MGQISQFLRRFDGGVSHYCPGCHEMHIINTVKPNANGAQWTWDQNIVAPTFSPSINIRSSESGKPIYVCHYFLRGGMLEFGSDCTHGFSGLKIRLPPLPDYMRDKCLQI